MRSGQLRIEELNAFYTGLSPDDREELLQCLLVAAARGGEAMMAVLGEAILVTAARQLIDNEA